MSVIKYAGDKIILKYILIEVMNGSKLQLHSTYNLQFATFKALYVTPLNLLLMWFIVCKCTKIFLMFTSKFKPNKVHRPNRQHRSLYSKEHTTLYGELYKNVPNINVPNVFIG